MDTLTSIVRKAINDAFDGYITKHKPPSRDLSHQTPITFSSEAAQSPPLMEPSQNPEHSPLHNATSSGSIWNDEYRQWRRSENPTASSCGTNSESSACYGPSLTPVIPQGGYDYHASHYHAFIAPAHGPVACLPDFLDSLFPPVDAASSSISVSSKLRDASTSGLPAEPSQAGKNEDPVLRDFP
jgi:hypothetical protein